MSQLILIEIYIFCSSIMLGIIMAIAYDVLRIFRRIIKRGLVLVAIEDVIALSIASIITFNMIFTNNSGNVRSYILVGIIIGILLYMVSISKFFVGVTSKYILILLQKLGKPFKMVSIKIKTEVKARYEQSKSKKRKQIK